MVLVEAPRKKRTVKIPPHLVYEEINGIQLPRKGWRDVLTHKKQAEEIMGSSSLQAIFVSILHIFIGVRINRKKYWLATNEPGLHLDKGDNFSNDIAIYEKKAVTINEKYFDTPPKIVLEIDVKIELDPITYPNDFDYVIEKSQKMLDFGTEKVIWIMTKSKKIFVISKTETWTVIDFNNNIHIIDDCTLNLAELMQEEGLSLEL